MTINDYIIKIREGVHDEKQYDEYVHLFREYIEFLRTILEENPCNIKAICQLAIAYMEEREPYQKSIELLEDAYTTFAHNLNAGESYELFTNLAFFYEEDGEIEKAKEFLMKAVSISSDLPNAHDALGRVYISEDNYVKAVEQFEKALVLKNDSTHQYNYAVALYQSGQVDEAVNIFYQLSNEWRSNEVAECAYYFYGIIKSTLGELETGTKVANDFKTVIDATFNISESEVADLFYICKDFAKHIEVYESCIENYYLTVEWVSCYLYSYYKAESKEKLLVVFNGIIDKKKNELLEEQADKDENWTKEERKAYIEKINNDINEFTSVFDSIVNDRFEPKIDFKPWIMYNGCYLIGCPRHFVE